VSSVFDEIRDAASRVAERARFVKIDEVRLREYAAVLPLGEIENPVLDSGAHLLGRGSETLAFFIVLDAVNFGSGWFPKLRKRPGCSGYFTVARSLTDWFRAEGAPAAGPLAATTPADCARIFGQDADDPEVGELMALFACGLSDLGRLLLTSYAGSFERLVESAEASAARLVEALAAMPLYRDVSAYGDAAAGSGFEVPFYKRAQLTCADLWLAFGGEGWGRFDDVESLTIFADNLVPHVLRLDRVLAYDPGLAARIDSGQLIAPGSPEEVEIRACAVAAVERISAELARLGRPVSPRRLDYWLWNRGGRPEFKAVPRHRARTPFY
jgi:Potential Queuosine, Q, salvage protein family